ncbi:tetraspanin-9-like [Penaeus monodon]|uniref:tetraspanin-9-like n=1 Tax=Penaeus monodon TaxID=6687 RepID=UPI0018A70E4D|nr:tetraspanin-9-like [Penaeus monodon]XP_037777112.1 tetraspanin-9-like [Penaeus monodon]
MGRSAEMGSCGKCVRFFMFAMNFIIWLASIAILVLGIWTVVDRPYLEQLLGNDLYITAAYILIATGCVIFFVSFLGCFGALKEIKCMLLSYFIIVLLLFIIVLIGGILGYVFKDKASVSVKNTMTSAMRDYKPDTDIPITKAWDETQQAMKCCGITEQSEWLKYNRNFKQTGNKVPKSCCKNDPNTGKVIECQNSPTEDNSYTEGCYKKARDFVQGQAVIIGGVGIAVAFIMLVGLILSIILFKLIN